MTGCSPQPARRQSGPALWTKNRPIAHAIARDFYLPGSDHQDVEQEALIGLWVAARSWDPDGGASFKTFARLVIKRRLATLLEAAKREKRLVLTEAARGEQLELVGGRDVESVVLAREELAEAVAAGADLVARRARWRENKRRQRQAA